MSTGEWYPNLTEFTDPDQRQIAVEMAIDVAMGRGRLVGYTDGWAAGVHASQGRWIHQMMITHVLAANPMTEKPVERAGALRRHLAALELFPFRPDPTSAEELEKADRIRHAHATWTPS